MKLEVAFFISTVVFFGGYQSAVGQSANSGTDRYSVNCDESASINKALYSGHHYIEFTGMCEEDVVVQGFARVKIIGLGRMRRTNRIESLTVNGPAIAILENFESGNIELAHNITGAVSDVAVVDGELCPV